MSKFSIIIPIFNEEKNLASTLNQIFQLLSYYKSIEFEIIAVNDGSTDKTSEILSEYSLKVITHKKNYGYGASLKDGIKNSKYDNLVILDADGTYPPFELHRIIKNKTSAPLIIGTRANYFSLIRHFANKILALFASLLFQKRITDLNSGMRLFKKSLLQQLNYKSWPDGFSFTTTMTLSFVINNYSIKNISIRCESRQGESKANISRLGFNILKIILQFFKQKYKFKT